MFICAHLEVGLGHKFRALSSELVCVVDLLRAGQSGAGILTGTRNSPFSRNRLDRLLSPICGCLGSLPAIERVEREVCYSPLSSAVFNEWT